MQEKRQSRIPEVNNDITPHIIDMCIFCGGACGGLVDSLMPVFLAIAVVLPSEMKKRLTIWAEKRKAKKTCHKPRT
jgi:hypothetical protein